MSSSDGPDRANLHNFQPAAEGPARGVDSLLLETLIYVLIEKGVLTRNDALSAVETVAQVKRGERGAVDDEGAASVPAAAALKLLNRLYVSFEALDDRPGVVNFDGENVHRLRPPLHGDRPKFPRDD